uniref:Uncharacterized protein n=1 Tax=Pararge aegeria TaxID=116150 RepID=S4NRC8_9NEOP
MSQGCRVTRYGLPAFLMGVDELQTCRLLPSEDLRRMPHPPAARPTPTRRCRRKSADADAAGWRRRRRRGRATPPGRIAGPRRCRRSQRAAHR